MRHRLVTRQPAGWWNGQWREGLPLGDGFTGALVYGGAAHERIMLSHARCWRETRQPEMPDVSDVLPEMRRLILAGRVPEADAMLVSALRERGYDADTGYPFPICDIAIETPVVRGFRRYRRELDLASAQALVCYEDDGCEYRRRAFVSRADGVFVLELSAARALDDVRVELGVHRPDEVNARDIRLPGDAETVREGEYICYAARVDGDDLGAVARVKREERRLTVVAAVFPEGARTARWTELRARLDALPLDYDALMARHLPLWQALAGRCELRLEDGEFGPDATNEELLARAYEGECPNALAERMWEFGRYLLMSATAPGSLPCPLMGLWSGEYRAGWAFNMANINLEMIYWQALPGRMSELALPVFDYYDGMLPGMRENARRLFGCRGIVLTAVSGPGNGRTTCLAPHIVNWTGGAGWIAQLYYDYWLFTGDTDFRDARLIPFLREVALFYLDFVIWQGDAWHVVPSVSPENRTRNYRGQGDLLPESMQSAVDATMDVAIIREVFTELIELGAQRDAAEETLWRRMLDGAPAYQVNEGGGVREWNCPDFPDNEHHRHQSHVYPLFPGREHARSGSRMFHIAEQRRLRMGLDSQTSWSLMLMACAMARARDADEALECLDLTARAMLMGNLFTVHNDWRGMGIGMDMGWAPFQIDANMGWTAAVQEMLLYSAPDCIELLPALPERWRTGAIGPLATRCGVEVELSWADGRAHAALHALRDARIRLVAGGDTRPVALAAGERIETDWTI